MCINSAKYIIIVAHSCQECEEKYFYDKHVSERCDYYVSFVCVASVVQLWIKNQQTVFEIKQSLIKIVFEYKAGE